MDSSKEYLDFILEQLSELDGISWRTMMGEYIIYCHGKIIGGIYDDRFLVKPTKSALSMMPEAEREWVRGQKGIIIYIYDVPKSENRAGGFQGTQIATGKKVSRQIEVKGIEYHFKIVGIAVDHTEVFV